MDISSISGIRQFDDGSKVPTNPNNELGQEEFLSLMIAQLQNQDPFKPMENGDFLGQMAQFSTVSGIGELKESFEATAQSLQGGQALQAASLVDRSALVESDQVAFDGENPVRGAFEVPGGATEAQVDIRDGTGALIQRVPAVIGADGRASFAWDGFDSDGLQRAPGSYSISASVRVGSEMQAADTLVWGRIESVTLGTSKDGSALLNIAGLGSVPLGQAKEIS
ncbi:flagellar hook assembly protein FlgD [Wenzhouxiangella limi]|uniref:Basal-body rod modification protein FlgD n=1 Tax=Wenzhouxiangella limi TaxID=2707351 RepID=A0A845V482_9GAMM|nr:flagellar hook assembly protein FlgD [Wenzhouxiangella limi]NDY97100.1 flagellar hook assembly protein FlgD [Wenzhouxiangella limi]